MDIVLEACDRYLFDRLYASLLPLSPAAALAAQTIAPSSTLSLQQQQQQQQQQLLKNATLAGALPAAAGQFIVNNGYVFRPASQYISFPPTSSTYSTSWPRDYIWRQTLSLYLITWIFGMIVYFLFATLSYVFIFDKATFRHPRYLKNQVRMEIRQTMRALPIMAIFTVPFFVIEVRGKSRMYDLTEDGPGYWYNWLQFPLFLLFTDCLIYWIHRGLHHPVLYKRLHKPHHKWIMPTPFASHAFHPLDGYAQSLPYHIFPFIFPLQKFAYVALFAFINIWTVLIHDGEYLTDNPVLNGAACHTLHHIAFNYNYGQFTTLWDRIGGSYRKPNPELFDRSTKMAKDQWDCQSKEMLRAVAEVEGKDDRVYQVDDWSENKKTR